jgi:hypothetical protein
MNIFFKKLTALLDLLAKFFFSLNPICLYRKNRVAPVFHAGIQRSGTNFLCEIIKNGFCIDIINEIDPERDSLFHKHFRIFDQKKLIVMDEQYHNDCIVESYNDYVKYLNIDNNTKIIVIYKDPINWLLSIKSWSVKCGWVSSDKEFDDVIWKYLDEYDLYYSKWKELSLKSPDVIKLVQYEVLVENLTEGYVNIGDFLKYKPVRMWNPAYVNHTGVFKKRIIPPEFKSQDFTSEVYNYIQFKPELNIYK